MFDRFGKVIQADTGTNAGEMQGHTKKINSCDFTSKRPFGIITGSEDRDVRHCKAFPIKDRILVKVRKDIQKLISNLVQKNSHAEQILLITIFYFLQLN